jgi:flagellar M-ring protein FliF
MLDKVVGPGNATVVVAADVSQNTGERVEESFTTPEGAPALSETTQTENYTGAGGTAAGVLGPDNIAVPNGTANGDGTFASGSTTKNNAVNKVTESTTIPSGAVARQTVSVAVNKAAAAGLNVTTVSDLVASAAGIDATRGDAVTVKVVDFNTTGAADAKAAIAAAKAQAAAEQQGALLRTGIITLGIVAVLITSLILIAKRSRRQSREEVDLGELANAPTTWDAATVPVAIEDPGMKLPLETVALPTPPALPAEPLPIDRKRADIDALAERDPHKTAEFLRSMMDERQTV